MYLKIEMPMASETELPRREREQLQHKQQIMDTAMRLFSTKGFHNVSMQEIAAEAEFAIGSLYKFFSSKDALYEAIMVQSVSRVRAVIDPVLDGDLDEKTKLSRLIRSSTAILCVNAPAIRLFLQANQQRALIFSPKPLNAEAACFHQTMLAKIESIVASGVSKGMFCQVDPHVAALAIDAAIRVLIFSTVEDGQNDVMEQRLISFEHLLFNGILNTRQEPSA
jgi:TetR/AcrR family transcriptional regulator